MVAAHVFYGLFLKVRYALGVEYQLLQFIIDALVVGLDVDDGS